MNKDKDIAMAAITLTETMFDNDSDGMHISIEMEGKKIDFYCHYKFTEGEEND